MRARLVVESGRWQLMKGQPSFDNVDELFALGLASVKLGDRGRAAAALEQLQGAHFAAPDADNKRLAEIFMYREVGGLYQILRGEKVEGLAALESAAGIESEAPNPIARRNPIKPAIELYGEALLANGRRGGRGSGVSGVVEADAAARGVVDWSRAGRGRSQAAGTGVTDSAASFWRCGRTPIPVVLNWTTRSGLAGGKSEVCPFHRTQGHNQPGYWPGQTSEFDIQTYRFCTSAIFTQPDAVAV